jgi:hypothetical protein
LKRSLLIIILLSVSLPGFTQTWAPIGAKWTYGTVSQVGNKNFREWISVKDTIIGMDTCKIIERKGPPVYHDVTNRIITYSDSNKIYWYNTFLNQFTVLYDFNKTAGQSWLMKIDSCDLQMMVDSTTTRIINGVPLKVLYIHTNISFDGPIIEGIGSLGRPYPEISAYCHGDIGDHDDYAGLRCFDDLSQIGFYNFNISPTCDDMTGLEENGIGEFNVFPNPSNGLFTIELADQAQITITNVLGEVVLNELLHKGKQQLNLEKESAGVYLLYLKTESGTSVIKLVKQ